MNCVLFGVRLCGCSGTRHWGTEADALEDRGHSDTESEQRDREQAGQRRNIRASFPGPADWVDSSAAAASSTVAPSSSSSAMMNSAPLGAGPDSQTMSPFVRVNSSGAAAAAEDDSCENAQHPTLQDTIHAHLRNTFLQPSSTQPLHSDSISIAATAASSFSHHSPAQQHYGPPSFDRQQSLPNQVVDIDSHMTSHGGSGGSGGVGLGYQVAQTPPLSPATSAAVTPVASPTAAVRHLVVPASPGVGIMVASGHFSMQGVRPEMEDRVTLLPHPEFNRAANLAPDGVNRSFFAVFDGHGGDVSAEYCRQHVHNNLMLSEHFHAGMLAEGLKAALVKTEADFCAACRRINLMTSSGTTAITAYLQADQLVVANIGDSRAVVCRSGRALDASIDHKPGRREERARIEALGGRVGITEEDAFRATPRPCPCLWACVSAGRPLRVFPGGLSVSRTIGDISMKCHPSSPGLVSSEPELWEARLTRLDEFLLLACDGVWDVMNSQQAVDCVRANLFRTNNNAEEAAKHLANEAFRKGSTDNISVVVVTFEFPKGANASIAAAATAAAAKAKPSKK